MHFMDVLGIYTSIKSMRPALEQKFSDTAVMQSKNAILSRTITCAHYITDDVSMPTQISVWKRPSTCGLS